MEKDKIETTAEITKPIYWQRINGDESGQVITFKDEGPVWITFNEGGRIATELRDEFLQKLDSDIAGEFVSPTNNIDPLNVGGAIIPNNTQPIEILEKVKSPIRILFDKQKKNNKIKLKLDFSINIPKKQIYELISTSFDENEVNKELHLFILDQLSSDDIAKSVEDSIKSLIEGMLKSE